MKNLKHSYSVFPRKKSWLLIGLFLFMSWLVWGNVTIQTSYLTINDPNIPLAFDDFTIAHVSDLHSKNWGTRLTQRLEKEQPNIIVITGDLIDRSKPDVSQAITFINEIHTLAPIYFVTGNHEAGNENYDQLREHMLALDVTILDNESDYLEQNGEEVVLMGLKDPSFIPMDDAYINHASIIDEHAQRLAKEFNGYTILLVHNPGYFKLFAEKDIHLVLAGHIHGGQFRLPFIGGLLSPDHAFFPPYSSGIYEENNTQMVVSRGLGNSMIPIRINNRPELLFVTFKTARQ